MALLNIRMHAVLAFRMFSTLKCYLVLLSPHVHSLVGLSASRAPHTPSSLSNVRLYSPTVAAQYVLHCTNLSDLRPGEPPALLKFLDLDFVTKSSSLVALHSWLIGIFYFTLMKSAWACIHQSVVFHLWPSPCQSSRQPLTNHFSPRRVPDTKTIEWLRDGHTRSHHRILHCIAMVTCCSLALPKSSYVLIVIMHICLSHCLLSLLSCSWHAHSLLCHFTFRCWSQTKTFLFDYIDVLATISFSLISNTLSSNCSEPKKLEQ